MANAAKVLRGQVRQVSKELFSKELQNEVYTKALEQVRGEIKLRLDAIQKQIEESLAALDSRQKDMQSFLVREATRGNQPVEQGNPPVQEDKKS